MHLGCFFFTSAIHVADEFLMCSNAVKAHVSTESCADNILSIFKT